MSIRRYAAPGQHLFLTARREELLEQTAAAARKKGAKVDMQRVDVTDQENMARFMAASFARAPLDLVIANAGISGGTHKEGGVEDRDAQDRQVLQTNVEGVLNTALPVIPLMRQRGQGQIALMSSLASFRGMPGAAAYCASKAAVRLYGEALREELAPEGIKINVICPGFVKTPMTDINRCAMPFLMEADKAAQIIADGLARNKGRISFPWQMALLLWPFYGLPSSWSACLASTARKG